MPDRRSPLTTDSSSMCYRQERVRALSKMRSEEDDDMMAVDFGGEMEQEDDSDAYLDQPPSSSALAAAMGSMTPPQAIIDPAEKLECLKSLHKVSALPSIKQDHSGRMRCWVCF